MTGNINSGLGFLSYRHNGVNIEHLLRPATGIDKKTFTQFAGQFHSLHTLSTRSIAVVQYAIEARLFCGDN
ncbi:hypothetical protein SAMN02982996_00779 [Lonsdalea quercina]|uniref:Uncharacterized protein n=1 Tax=Lonsdalea quercina TaxID=71657 RepID=A0A1H3XXC2_9GAMM|nr:hypothetical protein SAMN02982996_00779 [Lonsdalea quercina]